MEINNGLWDGAKHLWEILVACTSAIVSCIVYKVKKNKDRVEADKDMLLRHDTLLKLFEERCKNFDDDINEIKAYLKQILFKL